MIPDWFLEQIKTASPPVAMAAVVALIILWRQHVKDQKTIRMLTAASNKAMTSAAKALTRLATLIDGIGQRK